MHDRTTFPLKQWNTHLHIYHESLRRYSGVTDFGSLLRFGPFGGLRSITPLSRQFGWCRTMKSRKKTVYTGADVDAESSSVQSEIGAGSSVVNCSISSSDSSQLEESLFMIWSVNASTEIWLVAIRIFPFINRLFSIASNNISPLFFWLFQHN